MFLMDTLINDETSQIENSGLRLLKGDAKVKVTQSHFDTKMAKILSGSGGASCQMCTATFKQLHDISIVQDGFPINRTIHDANQYLNRLTKRSFLAVQHRRDLT